MIALSDPVAAVLSTVTVAGLVWAGWLAWEHWFGSDEPVPGQEPPSHVSVIPRRDWGGEVRHAHRVQQEAAMAVGDSPVLYDHETDNLGGAA